MRSARRWYHFSQFVAFDFNQHLGGNRFDLGHDQKGLFGFDQGAHFGRQLAEVMNPRQFVALGADQRNAVFGGVDREGADRDDAFVAVAAGEVDAAMQGLGTVTALLQSGRLRLLAVSTSAPLPQYPSVPTFGEAGMKDFTFNSWFAMVAPAGTPKAIVERLNDEVKKAINDPATRDKLLSLGVTPRGTSASEFGVATRNQYELYRKLIQDKGIRAE